MKLSVELEKWRADRPDEWKMDEFIRNAAKLEEQNLALAAQVEALRLHRHDLLDLIYNCAIGQVSMGYVVDAESLAQNAYSITGIDAASNRNPANHESPQHHLAELRAEAARAGFLEGYNGFTLYDRPHVVIDKANQYAEQIRREGK